VQSVQLQSGRSALAAKPSFSFVSIVSRVQKGRLTGGGPVTAPGQSVEDGTNALADGAGTAELYGIDID
jgi:hypothetical protein